MFFTKTLLAPARLTLFTRPHCGLCDTAKLTISKLRQRRPFDYTEVDIMTPENKSWKDVYEFDVPVLHVQTDTGKGSEEPRKLFHRFTEQEVEKVVDEVES
jgi:glutaredoxin